MGEWRARPWESPGIAGVRYTADGLLVEYSGGERVFYRSGLLWEMREYDAEVPEEILRGLISPSGLVN